MASWSQVDRDARAVEASTRRMEVLKPGAEFLRPGVQSSLGMLAIGGPLVAHWWQNVMPQTGSVASVLRACKQGLKHTSKNIACKEMKKSVSLWYGAKDDGRCQASRCWVLGLCQKM